MSGRVVIVNIASSLPTAEERGQEDNCSPALQQENNGFLNVSFRPEEQPEKMPDERIKLF